MRPNILYTLLICIFSFICISLSAQHQVSYSPSEFSDFVDDLICDYNKEIKLEAHEILDFLDSVATPNTSTCYSPIPTELPHAALEMAYEWPIVPCAGQYTVAYLGLTFGDQLIQSTFNHNVNWSGLNSQYYLVAFASEDNSGIGKGDLTIIITDLKLDFGSVNVENCLCTKKGRLLEPITDCTSIDNTPAVLYPWANNCSYNKYLFRTSGIVNGEDFTYDYWFIKGPQSVHNYVECNPPLPFNMLGANNYDPELAEAAVLVELTFDGAKFSLMTEYEGSINVVGIICECVKAPLQKNNGHRSADVFDAVSSLQLSPNPVVDHLVVDLELATAQEDLLIRLFDASGKMVLEEAHRAAPGAQSFQLSTEQLAKGLYHLQIQTTQQTYLEKVIKL